MFKSTLLVLLFLSFTQQCLGEGNDKAKLAIQLWSVKDALKEDFKKTLIKLSEVGFDGVEFAGYYGPFDNDALGLAKFLQENGLKASGAHVNFSEFSEKNINTTLKFYKEAKINNLIIGWEPRAWQPTGIEFVVKELNRISAIVKPLGFRLGIHSHKHSLDKYQQTTYWDYIAQHTTNDIILQQDVGWTSHVGQDPVKYVKRYPGRTLTTHYKASVAKKDKTKVAIIGKDSIDWVELLKANITVGGTQWFVIEQEEYPNGFTPLEAVELSFKGLTELMKLDLPFEKGLPEGE